MKLNIIFFLALAFMLKNPLMSQSNGWELADGTGEYFTSLYESENGDLVAAMAPKDNITKIVKLDNYGVELDDGFILEFDSKIEKKCWSTSKCWGKI